MKRSRLSVEYQPLDGKWQQLGSIRQGVVPENIRFDNSLDDKGCGSCFFDLNDDTRRLRSDLLLAPIVIRDGVAPVWSGRIIRTPSHRADTSSISVEAQGWPAHLTDGYIDKAFAVADMTRWRDHRSLPGTSMVTWENSFSVVAGDGEIKIFVPPGATATSGRGGRVTLDMGPVSLAKRIIVTYTGGTAANCALVAVGENTIGGNDESFTLDAAPLLAGPTTVGQTFATARRYVGLYLSASGGAITGAVGAAGSWITISSILVVTDTAYESGNASSLKASDVIKAALTAGAPMVSTDQSLIQSTSFNIPEYDTHGYAPTVEPIDAVNAYHQWQFFLTTEPTPRAVYRPVPTTATWALGEDDAYAYDDPSLNDATKIFSKAIAKYQDATAIDSFQTASAPSAGITASQILARRGYDRMTMLVPRSKLTAAGALQLAQMKLDTHQTPPLAGSAVVTGHIRRKQTGEKIHVSHITAGDVVLLENQQDPNTGAPRLAVIARVDYEDVTETARLTFDNAEDYIDALDARISSRQH